MLGLAVPVVTRAAVGNDRDLGMLSDLLARLHVVGVALALVLRPAMDGQSRHPGVLDDVHQVDRVLQVGLQSDLGREGDGEAARLVRISPTLSG